MPDGILSARGRRRDEGNQLSEEGTADREAKAPLVLVAEDEMIVAMELEGYLEERGCTVLGPFPTVRQALAALAENAPLLAVLDVNLRDGHVGPLAEALAGRDLPFVLITGFSAPPLSEEVLARAWRVAKPFSPSELGPILDQMIAAARA